MKTAQILEWIDGALEDSATFTKLNQPTQDALKKMMVEASEKIQERMGPDFTGTFLVKLAKELKKTNWLWIQNNQWPYAKWNTVKKSVFKASMDAMGVVPDQTDFFEEDV